jgi:hypothetical protein
MGEKTIIPEKYRKKDFKEDQSDIIITYGIP